MRLCFAHRVDSAGIALTLLACAVCWTGNCAAAGEPESPAEQGVLLLQSGRLVHGRISESSGGYVVDLQNGRMLVPFNQVRMQAVTPDEVYYKLRKTVPEGSVSVRLSLATWCLNNKLYNQARNEVQDVLKAEKDNPTARRMLTRIDNLLDTKADESPNSRPSLYERLVTTPEAKSLAGLSPNVTATFVSRVQPILMNNCALAGCHGPRGRSGFSLLRVHLTSGSRRSQSEQNLSATLRYVDMQRPESSSLLEKPRGRHGRHGRTIFRGRAGAKQLETLRHWTRMIAAESRPSEGSRGAKPLRKQSPAVGLNVSLPPDTARLRAGFGNAGPATGQLTPAMRAVRSRLKRATAVRGKKPAKRRNADARDPFDPAEFNRQSGPGDRAPRQPSPSSGPMS